MSWAVELRAAIGTLELDVAIQGGPAPVALIGPNGSGKSTLLRLIAGMPHPVEGSIRFGRSTFFDSSSGVSLPPEQRQLGYVPQSVCLFPHLTACDNVAFGLRSSGTHASSRGRRSLAQAQLEALDGGHLGASFPAELSGGEQQRVALARALVVEPAWLLLDEPLAALDLQGRRAVRRYLADRLRETQTPALFVTHDVRDVAALGADVCVMSAGHIVQRGTPEELRKRPDSDFVAEFFSS